MAEIDVRFEERAVFLVDEGDKPSFIHRSFLKVYGEATVYELVL
jgi:hypothetical protein